MSNRPCPEPKVPPPIESALDRADLEALRQEDPGALHRLILRWRRPLAGFACRYLKNSADAEDAVAETFVRLHRHRHKLRPESNLPAWLFTSLANLCRNRQRWRRRHPCVDFEALQHLAAPEDAPDQALRRRELSAAVRDAVGALPHDLRATLLLHQYAHLSHREIGAILDCSERGVETRLYRARAILRERLSGWADLP